MLVRIAIFLLSIIVYFWSGFLLCQIYIDLKGEAPNKYRPVTRRILGFLAHPLDLLRENGDCCYNRYMEPSWGFILTWPFQILRSLTGILVVMAYFLFLSLILSPRVLCRLITKAINFLINQWKSFLHGAVS